MKKLITLCAFIALLIISCDSPTTNINDQQQAPDMQQTASSVIPPGASRAIADSIRKAVFNKRVLTIVKQRVGKRLYLKKEL